MPTLLRLALAALSGWLVYLSYEPHGYWLAGIAGAGLLFAALVPWGSARPSAWVGALVGFVHATACYLFLLPWIGEFVGAMPYIALCVFLGLYAALLGGFGALVARRPYGWLGLPLVYAAVEFLRSSVPFGGFSWVRLGWGQVDGPLASLASWGGPALVSFAAALAGAGLVGVCVGQGGRRQAGACALLLPLVAGLYASDGVNLNSRTTGTVRVAAVQGNVPRLGLDFNSQRRAVLQNHLDETARLAAEDHHPDIVIWPENASDVNPFTDTQAGAAIAQAARKVGAPLLVGTITRDEVGERNTMQVFNADGSAGDHHYKRFLQPFGEYMPMHDFFRHFSDMVDLAGDFKAGGDDGVVRMGDTRVGVATCYEVAEDKAYRAAVLGGAQLLATPTNNATFGFAEMTYQQLAMSRMRAIELDRAVVVAATSGVTAMVHPDGTVSQQTGIFEAAHLVEDLPLRDSVTPAARFGGAVQWALALGGAAVALGALFGGRRGYAGRAEDERKVQMKTN